MDLTKTIQYYFHQPGLDSVTQESLEKLVRQYPYVGSLQYLLLKKMKQAHSQDTSHQWQKTQLYFQESYYLHALLNRQQIHPVVNPLVKELTTELADALAVAKSIAQATMQPDNTIQEPTPVVQPASPLDEPPPNIKAPDNTPDLRTEILSKESPIRIPSLRDLGPVTDDMPSFEPYHTIDYFASQGIKLNNQLPKDKLGKQLKSFTEWIRTMKKLPQAVIEEKLDDVGAGEKIVALAADSIEGKEILTETMAEVLLKQGNKARAREIFKKLSLAHPDKSAYFASRIEQLNKVP